MAVTLQITDGTTTANLANTTGAQLLMRWEPVVAVPRGDGGIPEYVTDVLPVIVNITGADAFASTMQDLHALQRRAAEFWADRSQVTPVWFHRKLDDETGAHRTLVRSIAFDVDAHFGSWIDTGPALTDGRMGNIAITHHPYWERTTATSAAGDATSSTSCLGGAIDYTTTDVVGDVPARLYAARLLTDEVVIFDRWWIGFRSANRVTTPSNFVALWECEDGTVDDASDCSITTDATASPGGAGNTKIQIDFTDNADWLPSTIGRYHILIDDVDAGNTADFFGRFVVLMRAKVDAGTAQVRVGQYCADIVEDRGVSYGPIVDISATDWTIYNCGTVAFPQRDRKALPAAVLAESLDDTSGLMLRARQKSGTPTLGCDCFILIPCDEYFLYVDEAYCTNSTHETYVGVSPKDEVSAAMVQVGANIEQVPPVAAVGAGVPTGDGRIFVCAANVDGESGDFSDNVGITVQLMPRWVSLRGAE